MIKPVPVVVVYGNYDFRLAFKVGDRLWRIREASDRKVVLKDYVREQDGHEYVILPYDEDAKYRYRWMGEKAGALATKWNHGWDKLLRTSSVVQTVTTASWRLVSPIEGREIVLERWALD